MVIRTCIALLLSISPLLAQLRPGDPASVGISRAGLDRVNALLESEVRQGLGAASILIARQGTIVLHKGFGQLSLADPVSTYLPEFTGGEKNKVRVLDLLAHTSGMPDMLPENTELRRAHAPLSEFVNRSYTTPLLF